ncbi:hypothetical protein PTNB73_07455 [Pyrenophora teres f. teres]|nr:hypothetical protein PTNB73_07455 [Pyrenophora teres f. teres]
MVNSGQPQAHSRPPVSSLVPSAIITENGFWCSIHPYLTPPNDASRKCDSSTPHLIPSLAAVLAPILHTRPLTVTVPPPPYQARNTSILAAPNQWTRFNTPYNTLSSVRTFTSSPRAKLASSTSQAPSPLSPESQQAVDEAIEQIQELYGTARDEFEIASEESEKNTTYAPDDRAAAREELDRLLEYYNGLVERGDRAVADEVKRRVGQRIRELENAVLAMEEAALHGD